MKKLRMSVSIALCIAMLFALGACAEGDSGKGNEKSVKAVMITPISGGAFWSPIEEGWLSACEELGWEGEYWTPTALNSVSEILELIETAITQKYDVISVDFTDSSVVEDALKRAREAGIVIIGIMTADAPGLVDAYVAMDPVAFGVEYGTYFGEIANADGVEELNLLTIQTSLANMAQNAQREALVETLQKVFKGTVNVIGQDECNSNAATAQDKTKAFYLANPELNIVLGLDGAGMSGITAFVEENDLAYDFYSMNGDTTPGSLAQLRDGFCSAIMELDLAGAGRKCAMVGKQVMDGENFDYFSRLEGFWITRDNLDEYCTEHNITLP